MKSMDRFGLDRESIDRLIKLLGMLGSAHDGERAAAGLKAHEFIRRHGLCWADIIHLPSLEYANDDNGDAGAYCAEEERWRRQREYCLARRTWLTVKELTFLMGIRTWSGPLTERQQSWLDGIHARLHGERP
jgi:hypothetical protein